MESKYQLIVTIINKGRSEEIIKASGRPAQKGVQLFTVAASAFTNAKCSWAFPLNRKRSLF